MRLLAGTRLLTITGPGGCGKTRLAIELARELAPEYRVVAFVDLGNVRDGALVASTVAEAVGMNPESAGVIARRISDIPFLLLVDNAEHVIDEVAWLVQDLLTACAGLVVVVTSRELLNIGGEVRWRVPSLSLPPAGSVPAVAQLSTYDAVQLFCARAAEQEPGFRLTAANGGLVTDICRRLDGIPLALELAAARVRSLPLPEIVARLGDSVRLLTGGSRTAIARHQTLRAALDWSHELLAAPEQVLFRRLSLFVDTFDIEATEAVCADAELDAAAVPDILTGLVDKSMVTTVGAGDGGLRYSLIEAVRQYGREKLVSAGETHLAARHAHYYASVVAQVGGLGVAQDRVQRLVADFENVRLALDWCTEEDVELEVQMVDCLRWYWRVRGSVDEALMRVRAALQKDGLSPKDRANLLTEAGVWFRRSGDIPSASVHSEAALALVGQLDDPVLINRIHGHHGVLRAEAGDLEGAERAFETGLSLGMGRVPDSELIGWANNLAMVRLRLGRPQDALAHTERAIELWRRLGPTVWAPELFHTYGSVLLNLGRHADARLQFLAGLGHAVDNANYPGAMDNLHGLAQAVGESDPALAMTLLGAAEACHRVVDARPTLEARAGARVVEGYSRKTLGPARGAEAFERGLHLSLREMLEVARGADDQRRVVLTPRKREIAGLVASGLSNKQIAQRLAISERTVDAHLEQLRNLLGLHNRAQVAVWALGDFPAPAEPAVR